MASIIREVQDHWAGFFDGSQYSTQEFYQHIEDSIEVRNLPSKKIKRVKFFQDGRLWVKREYLRVKNSDFIFDICGAPYGNGFFVSWRVGKPSTLFYRLIIRIPFIGPVIQTIVESKTYYQIDAMLMFKLCVKICVDEAIEKLSNDKGQREVITP